MTDPHHVLAYRRAAELRVEGRGAGELRGGDFRQLAEAAQGFIGQVAIVGLDGLQQPDGGLLAAALLGYYLVYEREVDGGRGC